MPVTDAQKRAMAKWRESNKEHYQEKQREYQKKYYDNNTAKILEYKKHYYEEIIKPKRQNILDPNSALI